MPGQIVVYLILPALAAGLSLAAAFLLRRRTAATPRALAFDGVAQSILVVSPQGRVLDANTAALELIGRPAGQVIGCELAEVFAACSILLERYREPGRAEARRELLKLGGRVYDVRVMPLRHGSRRRGWLVVISDITELSAAEAALRQAREEAEAAGRAKSQFLANMSHELRTPLTTIIGFSELLSEEVFGPLSDKQKDYQHMVTTAGKRLLELVENVLSFATAEAGQLELRLGPVAAAELIREAGAQASAKLGAGGNVLALELPGELSFVQADDELLRQVLDHLIDNAAKFTHGGKVTLSASEDREAGWVFIHISDTGIGIAPESASLIFRPFTQLDASTTRRYSGGGLGLALCEHYCALMGADLSLQSALGTGSTFTIRLRAAEGSSTEAPSHVTIEGA